MDDGGADHSEYSRFAAGDAERQFRAWLPAGGDGIGGSDGTVGGTVLRISKRVDVGSDQHATERLGVAERGAGGEPGGIVYRGGAHRGSRKYHSRIAECDSGESGGDPNELRDSPFYAGRDQLADGQSIQWHAEPNGDVGDRRQLGRTRRGRALWHGAGLQRRSGTDDSGRAGSDGAQWGGDDQFWAVASQGRYDSNMYRDRSGGGAADAGVIAGGGGVAGAASSVGDCR